MRALLIAAALLLLLLASDAAAGSVPAAKAATLPAAARRLMQDSPTSETSPSPSSTLTTASPSPSSTLTTASPSPSSTLTTASPSPSGTLTTAWQTAQGPPSTAATPTYGGSGGSPRVDSPGNGLPHLPHFPPSPRLPDTPRAPRTPSAPPSPPRPGTRAPTGTTSNSGTSSNSNSNVQAAGLLPRSPSSATLLRAATSSSPASPASPASSPSSPRASPATTPRLTPNSVSPRPASSPRLPGAATPLVARTDVMDSVTGLTAQDIQAIVDMHNQFRANHGSPPLVWDASLARDAAGWASRCTFAHSTLRWGENVAMGGASVTSLVNMWYSTEACSYDYARPGGLQAGHFTQVVWASTQRIGCARAGPDSCGAQGGIRANGRLYPNSHMLVCEYDPAGNGRDYPSNVKQPITPPTCIG